jgi:hypothetical protein
LRHAAELPRQPPLVVRLLAFAAGALIALLAAPAAHAQNAGSTGADPGRLRVPASEDQPPPGRRLSARQAQRIAVRQPKVIRERAERRGTYVRTFLKGSELWQVAVFAPSGKGERPDEIAQVIVSDRTGRVVEAWTGFRVDWFMARGYPGAFGRKINSPVVWLGLCLLFLLPFLRPPWRLVHLDAAVIAGFGISYALFNVAEIEWSVPLVYPLLLYLLVRMLMVGRRGVPDRWSTWMDEQWLVLGAVFLLGFRVALNVVSSNVIDVGFAGVIGADLMAAGEGLYDNFPASNLHGDTYGPLAYLAYVPFEQLWPWSGEWDDLPAAHAAAVTFDAACVALLWRKAGVLAAYLWLACPWTLFVMNTNANDTLVGVLVLAAVVAASGGLTAAAGMVKFAPLALAPLLIGSRRSALAFVAVLAACLLFVGDLGTFYERTLSFQADRDSPFSIWGLYDLGALQYVAAAGALGLALGARWVGREKVALAAAVLIGLQLAVDHWFYLYLAWFLPLLFVLFARGAQER